MDDLEPTPDMSDLVGRIRAYDGMNGHHSDAAGADAYELLEEAADTLEKWGRMMSEASAALSSNQHTREQVRSMLDRSQ